MSSTASPFQYEQYLPTNHDQWRQRIRELITELRNDELEPSRVSLYQQRLGGPLMASIEGVIVEMAIRGGIPAVWVEMPVDDPDDEDADTWDPVANDHLAPLTMYVWGVEPAPDHQSIDAYYPAITEALAYHGFDISEGFLAIDVMDCDMGFVREVVNGKHGVSFGADSALRFNIKMVDQGANPLHLMADLLEHLIDRRLSSIWHPLISNSASDPSSPTLARSVPGPYTC